MSRQKHTAEEIINKLREVSVPKSAHLRYELDPAMLNMRGDIGQIQQVVMNLIINAGETLGAKPGHITVRTRHIEITENHTEFWRYTNIPLPPGEYVSFQVNDTGDGIKPEVLTRIFDPFFTTKFTGRGLGLAAVLGIIRGHHGGIRIQSERGKGTGAGGGSLVGLNPLSHLFFQEAAIACPEGEIAALAVAFLMACAALLLTSCIVLEASSAG